MIVYEFGSCKKRIITTSTYYGSQMPVTDSSLRCESSLSKRTAKDCRNCKETQTAKNSAETRRIRLQQKLQVSENKVARNKYYNYHVLTPATCNMHMV